MDTFIPNIQMAMRQEGLSRFSAEESQQVVFGPTIKMKGSTRWVFSNRLQTEVVLLSPDYFVYQVSSYSKFDDFSERLLCLLATVVGVVGLDFAEQIGLRYIDLVRSTEKSSVEEMICPTLRGLSEVQLGVKKATVQFVIQAETEAGIMMLRSFESNDGQFIPPDLQTPHLKFGVELNEGEDFRVLDFDHIARGDFDFQGKPVRTLLWSLHDGINRAFRNAVTEKALAVWSGDSNA